MKPFRATYTPEKIDGELDKENARLVLVVAVLIPDREYMALAIFIDSAGKLGSDTINHFTNCQAEWPSLKAEGIRL